MSGLRCRGKYIPFGVFALYKDSCLRDSLEACMSIVLQIPSFQIEVRSRNRGDFVEAAEAGERVLLFTNHIAILSQMASEGFINLVRFVVLGIDSFGACRKLG